MLEDNGPPSQFAKDAIFVSAGVNSIESDRP